MNTRPFLLPLFSLLVFANNAFAQTSPEAKSAPPAAPTVTVSATSSGVRFAALGSVKQTRLEVYDAAGARVFDSDFLAGNVRDWQPQKGAHADGTYQCVFSARDLAGRLSVKQAAVLIAGGQASLSLGEAEGAGGVAPATQDEGPGAATLATHDGGVGSLTSTAGDLTLRTGDLLAGRDEERVRVTANGRVGIGTSAPEMALDVAGEIKAREGFRFSDGSKLSVDEKGALARTSAGGERLAGLGASVTSATANRLAKFADAAGTLSDSTVFETGGFVGIGTTSPEGTFHIQSPETTVFKVVTSGSVGGGRAVFQMYRGASAQTANGWDFGYNTDLATEGFIIRELTSGAPTTRLAIQKGTGNVGIGTSAPRAPLDVVGNAVQNLSASGFAKAMVLVTITQNPDASIVASISRCFNGVLNSSTANCGFTPSVSDVSGNWRVRVNFGFTVDNRFVSFTQLDPPGNTALQTSFGRVSFFDSTTVQTLIPRQAAQVFIFVY